MIIKWKIIIREWIYGITLEFRCYIHDNDFRATSGFNVELYPCLDEIKSIINKIKHYCEYRDFTIDFGIINNKLILIEINTPVYLCATSGNFNLDIPYDYEVLLGEYQPDVISYPIIRWNTY